MMKHKVIRRILSIFTALVICLSYATPMGTNLPFGESLSSKAYGAEHWADPFMKKLVSDGVLQGNKQGELNPEMGITRAEFVTMINRAFGYKKKGTITFTDVPQNEWFANDIAIAYNQGYFTGAENNLAKPNDILKREEAVTLLCRALKIEGISDDSFRFTDSRDFSYWSKEYIYAATQKEYINGYPDQTFRPSYQMKRGEMSKVLADATGSLVQQSGDTTVGYTAGNVTLNTSGTTLRNTTIPGDLYITGGVGLGYTTLENVTVLGDLIISGAGESNQGGDSVVLKDCNIRTMYINSSNGKKISVRAEGNTDIDKTVVKSEAYLEEANVRYSAFKDVELNGPTGTGLHLSGIFDNVSVFGPSNSLFLQKGYISRLQVDEEATAAKVFLEKGTEANDVFLDVGTAITGQGKIVNIVVGTNGSNISMLPENIAIRPGVTATINGKPMTSADAELNALKPTFINGPTPDNVLPTAADAIFQVNKPGKVYWMVKPYTDGVAPASPSLTDLTQPKTATGVKFANLSAMQNTNTTIKMAGLTAGTKYDLFTVLVDLGNNSSTIVRTPLSTTDNIQPKFHVGTPVVTPNATSVAIEYSTTKDATVYWAALKTKTTAPLATDIMNTAKPIYGSVARGYKTGGKDLPVTISTTSDANVLQGTLAEATPYDLYFVIKDYSGNVSTVTKISTSTKDVTAAKFLPSYPKVETSNPTTLILKYSTDKDTTLYWAVYKKDTKFPPISPNATPPAIGSTEELKAKQNAVMTGNSAVKFGKVNTTNNKEGSVNITGLSAQSLYDLYLVLEDKAKNLSPVTALIDVSTLDNTKPAASLVFSEVINGNPVSGSDINLQFSEVVYTTDNVRLRDMTDKTVLRQNIQLYDNSGIRPALMNITFSALSIKEEDSKTVVTFNKDSINLASGNKYYFVLNNIKDSSNNKMDVNTKLPEFMTVPPLVDIFKQGVDGQDIGFIIEPQVQNTAPSTRFDIILQSDANIEFELSTYNGNNGVFSSTPTSTFSNLTLQKNVPFSLELLMKSTLDACAFTSLSSLTDMQYALKITKLEGNTIRNSWNQNVTVTAKGITGSQDTLRTIAADVNRNLNSLINSADAAIVTNPNNISITKAFSDSVTPTFNSGYPKFIEGDAGMRVQVNTDKECTFYWVLAEANKITTTPDALQILSGNPKTQGGQSGNYPVSSGGTEVEFNIENLKPETDYVIYYLAKGTPAAKNSDIGSTIKTTLRTTQPTLEIAMDSAGNKYVDIKANSNSTGKLYWMIFATDSLPPASMTAEDLIIRPGNLMSMAVNSGDQSIIANETITVRVNGLDEKKVYKFFATVQKPLSASPATMKFIDNVRSADRTPPAIDSASTSLSYYTTELTPNVYTGSLYIAFTEPLYYITNVGDGTYAPLTVAKIQEMMPDVVVSSSNVEPGTNAVRNITIKFSRTNMGAGMSISNSICDASNMIAGQLIMTLLPNTDPLTSSTIPATWKVEFK